jgi:hypothetical protein
MIVIVPLMANSSYVAGVVQESCNEQEYAVVSNSKDP